MVKRVALAFVSLGLIGTVAGAAATQAPAPSAAAEKPPLRSLPPTPPRHFNDGASLVSAEMAQRLDEKLVSFERESGHQVMVATFTVLPFPPMEEFTLRTANAWGVGRKGRDDGVVLFVFVKDRKMRLEVGRGLEAVLTDEASQQILDQDVAPAFRRGEFGAGLEAGIDAVLARLRAKGKSLRRS